MYNTIEMRQNRRTFITLAVSIGVLLTISMGCSKNSDTNPYQFGSVKDYEGNDYSTIAIGSQTWMAENLRSIKLNDGTPIAYVSNNYSWSTQTTPGYSYFSNDSVTYKKRYGALYNWYTVQTKKICPTGWHVPTDQDWTTLGSSLGIDSIAGGKLKATGTTYWYVPNLYATNSTGFSGIGSGYRFYNGSYNNSGYSATWWSATEYTANTVWYRFLSYNNGKFGRTYADKLYGFSIRCLKD